MGIFSSDEKLSDEELKSLFKEKTLEEKYEDLKKNVQNCNKDLTNRSLNIID